MDDTITALMAMLDWNNSEETQQKGIELAKTVQDLNVFLQPLSPSFNKNVWNNCAKILYGKSDYELEPYLVPLLEWLQDLNWPGALLIVKRLSYYGNRLSLATAKEKCLIRAKAEKDSEWLDNLTHMLS
jgi:hypothetical protein